MESILDILQCKLCLSQLNDPVTLPCGESICEQHTKELREDEWRCPLCAGLHILATGEKYPVTKPLVAMLKTNISKLDFGPVHKKAKEEVEAVEAEQRELMHAIREPKDLVATFAIKYRNQVDLVREEMINVIDRTCDGMKTVIAQYEAQSEKRLRQEAPKINEMVKALESKTAIWKKDLDELVVNESLWVNIEKESCREQVKGKIKESLLFPSSFAQIRTVIERHVWTKLSDRLKILPLKISDMRDEKYVLVRDVSKINKAKSWEHSKSFDFQGMKLSLGVRFKPLDGKIYLGAVIHSDSNHRNHSVTMKWTTFIIGKYFQIIQQHESSPVEFTQQNRTWGFDTLMPLRDIMAHPAYDAHDDMIRVEVEIDHRSFLIKNV